MSRSLGQWLCFIGSCVCPGPWRYSNSEKNAIGRWCFVSCPQCADSESCWLIGESFWAIRSQSRCPGSAASCGQDTVQPASQGSAGAACLGALPNSLSQPKMLALVASSSKLNSFLLLFFCLGLVTTGRPMTAGSILSNAFFQNLFFSWGP